MSPSAASTFYRRRVSNEKNDHVRIDSDSVFLYYKLGALITISVSVNPHLECELELVTKRKGATMSQWVTEAIKQPHRAARRSPIRRKAPN